MSKRRLSARFSLCIKYLSIALRRHRQRRQWNSSREAGQAAHVHAIPITEIKCHSPAVAYFKRVKAGILLDGDV